MHDMVAGTRPGEIELYELRDELGGRAGPQRGQVPSLHHPPSLEHADLGAERLVKQQQARPSSAATQPIWSLARSHSPARSSASVASGSTGANSW